MKKLFAMILTLALTISLAAPALAAESADPGQTGWQLEGYESLEAMIEDYGMSEAYYYRWAAIPAEQKTWTDAYAAAHPDDVEAFDADAYYAHWGMFYAESKESFMAQNGLTTQEEFKDLMLLYHIYDQEAVLQAVEEWAAAVAMEPAMTAKFLAEVDGWLINSWNASTLAEYMATCGYNAEEQAYVDLYYSWKSEYEDAQAHAAARSAHITELGGTPGQINLLVNDRCISFGAAKPRLNADGVLSAPADALSHALGILVKGDAEGYAPVRFTAENAGWDVLWDEEYQTAVLLNRNGIIGDIDAKFSRLEQLFGKLLELVKREEGQSYRIDETFSLSLTALNSLDGDKTYTANVKGTATVKDGAISAALTLDLAGLVRQLSPELREAVLSSFPQKLSAGALTQLLTGIKVEVILNPGEGLYVHAPILAQLLEDFDAESWMYFEFPYYGGDEDGTADADPSPHLGAMIYDSSFYSYNYMNTYSKIMAEADTLANVLGNDRFTGSGDDISYSLDTKTVNRLIAKATEDSYSGSVANAFRAADVTVALSGGKLSFEAGVRPNTEAFALQEGGSGSDALFAAWVLSFVDFSLDANGSMTADGTQLSTQLHWRNQWKATLSYSSDIQKTSTPPAVAPPAAASVVDAYEYFYGYTLDDGMYSLYP